LPALLAIHIWLIIIAFILIGGGIFLKWKRSRIKPRRYLLVGIFTISLPVIFLLAILIGDNSLSFFRPLFNSVFQLDNLLKQLFTPYGSALAVFSILVLFLIGVSVLIRKRKQG